MPPRRRANFTEESIDQKLQEIHLLDPQSSSENLEQLGPIINQIYQNRQQDAYLRTLKGLVDAKDAEIERICGDNYQDFISSLGTLSDLRRYTTDLRETITALDGSVAQLGRALVDKKRALLATRRTGAHLDEAIDGLQACLRVLDVVARVGDMIRDGKYWNALRSLEDIQRMPPSALSQTPLVQHMLASLPSLRAQVKDAVTASSRQWLLEMREVSAAVGARALDGMLARARRWRQRCERDPLLRASRVGGVVEGAFWEKADVNVLEDEKLGVDFKPLYQCIHIYTALESLDELRKSYQADRKAQSDLILPSPIPLAALPKLVHETTGFFVIEAFVLAHTGGFRAPRDVAELWAAVVARLVAGLAAALRGAQDPEALLAVKEQLLACMNTLESADYPTAQLHEFILVLFDQHNALLARSFGLAFDKIVAEDDCQPVYVESAADRDAILNTLFLNAEEDEQLRLAPLPVTFPWSQSFAECCNTIDKFTRKFYQYTDGLSHSMRNLENQLGQALDSLLVNHVAAGISRRLASTKAPQQIGQIILNIEHLQAACPELESSLARIRPGARSGGVRLSGASAAFAQAQQAAHAQLTRAIAAKLDDFFELSEYDWTPGAREQAPSMYLYELVNWLTTVVDALAVREADKDEAYRGAVAYIAECLTDFLVGPNVPMLNENALSNVVVDVDFLDDELRRINRAHLSVVFAELRALTSIPLADTVQEYLVPGVRQASYEAAAPRRLRALLEKLARYGASCRDAPSREKGEKRRKEAEAVGKLPGA